MIIFKVIGGLGNQMFQYATGRSLSLDLGATLKLDNTGFLNYGLHQGFELPQVFNCQSDIATEDEVRSLLGWQFPSSIRRIVGRPGMSIFRCNQYIVEPHFSFWSGLGNIKKNSYLAGYWQSEKYFHSHADVIRHDFSFTIPLSKRNVLLAEKICRLNSISLHVRRGDYATHSKTMATLGLCSLDYYQSAIRYVAERVEQPNFFIFSDDIPWVRAHLTIDFPCVYVDHNKGTDSYNDMCLMSMCKHHIIANSSFSWWGAWLNPSAHKIVIAPRRWFANDTDVSDLIPSDWVTL